MSALTGRSAAPGRRAGPDLVGVLVLGACAGWSLVTAAGREARPEGILLAVLAVAAGYALGRISGSLVPVAAAACAASAGLLLAYASRDGVPGATVDPLPGHIGVSAALPALAAGAACCGAWAARTTAVRLALRLLAAGCAGTALALGSAAGCAAALGVLLCSLAAARMRHRTVGLAGLAAVAALVAVGSVAVAEDVLPDGLTVSLEGQLTPERVLLWRDAVDLAEDHPVRGTGPDRFGSLSPVARQSPVAAGKPHSALLQQASEQGAVGATLLGAAYGWMLYALWRSPRPTSVVLTAGAGLTALAAFACVGNALSFTPVTMGAGLLAGLATARPHGDGRREAEQEVQAVRARG
ncbi:O-antigen ligase family protein [Streptomyces sp. NPDC059991]|uniref:O-antigen ligase family protein n=1 Tax=Streptomyces sp. NPDC059991 TaxID=3347028 RepID=UPI0036D07D10